MGAPSRVLRRLCPDAAGPARAVAAIGLLLLALYATRTVTGWGLLAGWRSTLAENGAMACGATLAALRARRDRAEGRVWGCFAAGIALWTAGNLTWETVLADAADPPYPSVADALWLASYLPVFAGLTLLARTRVRQAPVALWLDGLVGGLAITAVAALLVIGPVVGGLGGDPAAAIVNIVYPAADLLVLLVVLVVAGAARDRLDRSWLFIVLAFGVFVAADSLYLVQDAQGTYVADRVFDVGWPLGLLLLGVAACQPARAASGAAGRPSLAVPVTLAVAMVGLLLVDHYAQAQPVAVVLSCLSLLAILARLVVTHHETRALLTRSQHAALSDALTDLPNRRALLADLDAALAGGTPWVLAIFDLNGFKPYNDTFGHPAGDALLTRLARRLADAAPAGGRAYRMGGDEFCVVAPCPAGGTPSALLAPALDALVEQGAGFRISSAHGHVLLPREARTASDALSIADRRLYADKHHDRLPPQRQASDVLLRLVEERDGGLASHVEQVAELAHRTAVELGLRHVQLEEVVLAARLHDIGKAAIPDRILRKKGPLTDDEWAFLRRHTVVGERILSGAQSLEPVARIVRAANERWDGGGYPDGLSGTAIPLAARIVFVCDVFDAMTRDRPYRAGVTATVALDELRRQAGSQFDPLVVDAFARACAHGLLAAPDVRPAAAGAAPAR